MRVHMFTYTYVHKRGELPIIELIFDFYKTFSIAVMFQLSCTRYEACSSIGSANWPSILIRRRWSKLPSGSRSETSKVCEVAVGTPYCRVSRNCAPTATASRKLERD